MRTERFDAVKRGLDVTLASAALLVSAPVQLVTAGVVLASMGRPVLFRQVRPGRGGVPFDLVKFRTMANPDADQNADTAYPDPTTDAARLTAVGRFMRATSLDELPTFWNVLRGDMSLVGPRPLLMEYLDRYTAEQARRHEVRPGVTGLAQVEGRNGLDWDARLALDVSYVDRRSLALDARILLRTVLTVLSRRGVSAPGEATMSVFQGSRPIEPDADGVRHASPRGYDDRAPRTQGGDDGH